MRCSEEMECWETLAERDEDMTISRITPHAVHTSLATGVEHTVNLRFGCI